MPLDPGEFPDSRFHKYCPLCEQWHHPEHGCKVLRKGGPFSALIASYRRAVYDDDPRARWICFSCQKNPPRHPLRWLGTAMVLIVLAGLAWAAWSLFGT
jgi:hypothetical protein